MKKKIIKWAVVLLCFAIFCIWQNNYLSESDYTFTNSKINSSLDGYKIVQISDLHNKKFGKNHRYIISKIKDKEPDMIVITGDIVDANHTDIDTAVSFVEEAVKIAPVYYVTGNHEFWLEGNDLENMINKIENMGAICIDNEYCRIEYNDSFFNLIGLCDENLNDNTLSMIMENADKEAFTLLLAHEPEYFENYSKEKLDLVLSGHVHGGQIRLPFIGGLLDPAHSFFPKYSEGEYFMDDTTMIVSRGLGNSVIPLRIFNFPEIVCIELNG